MSSKLFFLKENCQLDSRVALTPDCISKIHCDVFIERGAGIASGFRDEDYGDTVKDSSFIEESGFVVSINPADISVLQRMQDGIVYCVVSEYFDNQDRLDLLKSKSIDYYALNLIPRTTKAQYMDVLSSQATLAGYRAIIEAFYHSSKVSMMLTTCAGTIKPAKVLVIGAGVAGLSAIGIAKRLGCIVYAMDSRSSSREQIESLGASFISVDDTKSTDGVYAVEMGNDYQRKQSDAIIDLAKDLDIIITTAQIPFKQSPVILTKDVLYHCKPGCVIVDLSSRSGGNCEVTEHGKITNCEGCTVISSANILNNIARDASLLLSKNITNWLNLWSTDKTDEIITATRVFN